MIENLTFITGNANKAAQVARYLPIALAHKSLDLVEIQSLDLAEIVGHKAREAFKHIGSPVLIEDVSLTFSALGRLPGPLIKWFLQELKPQDLCNLVKDFEDKAARAEVLYGLFDGASLKTFHGEIGGRVAEQPKGENGFGFDFVFIPDGYNKTRAELVGEDYDKTSPRRVALEKLEKFLKTV